jgi:tRNA(Ile)-lysidine synthase
MPSSHPPTLLTLARRAIVEGRLFAKGDRVLVAVSGGPDSMALLHVLARLRKDVGHDVLAHGVDHGLRPEAGAELDLAEAHAKSLGVPFGRTSLSLEPGGNLQARARTARFAALRQAAQAGGAAVIATGHHADDRAETVLIRLLQGAGPRGLAVLPLRAGDLVRPLLHARRADIQAHLARHDVPFATDPSNSNPRFLRPRVRHEVLPVLQQLSPAIVTHLCALADQLASHVEPATPGGPHMHTLPRATRVALGRLAQIHSKKARVRLPGGLVASYDRTKLAVVVVEDDCRKDGPADPIDPHDKPHDIRPPAADSRRRR